MYYRLLRDLEMLQFSPSSHSTTMTTTSSFSTSVSASSPITGRVLITTRANRTGYLDDSTSPVQSVGRFFFNDGIIRFFTVMSSSSKSSIGEEDRHRESIDVDVTAAVMCQGEVIEAIERGSSMAGTYGQLGKKWRFARFAPPRW